MSEQPMRRTQARAAERERRRAQQQRANTIKNRAPLILGMVVVVFVIFVVATTMNQTTVGTLGARFQSDVERIDLGKQIFDKPVRATFTIKNVGDSSLRLDVPKVATLLEGC